PVQRRRRWTDAGLSQDLAQGAERQVWDEPGRGFHEPQVRRLHPERIHQAEDGDANRDSERRPTRLAEIQRVRAGNEYAELPDVSDQSQELRRAGSGIVM